MEECHVKDRYSGLKKLERDLKNYERKLRSLDGKKFTVRARNEKKFEREVQKLIDRELKF